MSSLLVVNPVSLPVGDAIAKPKKTFRGSTLRDVIEYLRSPFGFITEPWLQALDQQGQQITAAPQRLNTVSKTNQGAAIAATDLTSDTIAEGLYEVRVYARITTRASTGAQTSSLTITIRWTEGGVAQSEAFTALTGNQVTTVLTGAAKTIRADAATPITYETAYASDTAGQMRYRLDLVLSRVAA